MFDDREYQTAALEAIQREFLTVQSTLLEQATGTGKTVVFGRLVKSRLPKRALILAHRNELIVQAKEKMKEICGCEVEIEKADQYANTHHIFRAPIVVSSIQTQCSGPKDNRRYRRFNPNDFATVIADECHHSTANSWRETIDHYLQNPNCRLLGVTATSDRADGEALGQVFKTVAYKYGILDAIRDGYLVDVTQQFVKVGNLDFSHIKTTQGDLNEAELSRIMESEDVIQRVCQASLEAMFALKPKTLSEVPVPEWGHFFRELKRHPRRTIVFTVSVPQAEMTANIFSRVMGGVEWVCGDTKKETRTDILGRFKTGETSVCVNCQVLTEGYDNPQVELIIMARPTKSRSLYAQMVGRSTRTLPGVVDDIPEADVRRLLISQSAKPFCRVLDFVGNSGKHKLVSVADILGGHVSEAAAEEAKKVAMSKESPVKMMVTMSNAEIELERQRQAAMDKARKLEEARKSHLLAKTEFHITDVDPFSHRHERIPIDKRHSKDGRIFSENQAKVLRLAGCDPSRFGYKQGQAIIAGYYKKHPGTPRQLEILRNFGFDPSDWSHQQVKSALEKLNQNNWRTAVTP
jgi:superfamily II DNA or RNA helicase